MSEIDLDYWIRLDCVECRASDNFVDTCCDGCLRSEERSLEEMAQEPENFLAGGTLTKVKKEL
jgi:hypothetical protein